MFVKIEIFFLCLLKHITSCFWLFNLYIYIYDFQQFETIRFFGDNIYTGKISANETQMDHANLLEKMLEFDKK